MDSISSTIYYRKRDLKHIHHKPYIVVNDYIVDGKYLPMPLVCRRYI